MANQNQLDSARYRRAVTFGTLVPMLVFGISAALQSELFQVARGLAAYGEIYSVPLWARLVANVTAALVIAASIWFLPIDPRRRKQWLPIALGGLAGGVLIRSGLQLLLGVYPMTHLDLVLVDFAVGMFCALFSLAVGVLLAEAFYRARAQERAAAHQALRAKAALDALQAEELRVRRDVAEGLHGTVQQRLVLLGSRLRNLAQELPVGAAITSEHALLLAEAEREVDDIREYDVREMSQLLYPEGVDLGLTQAVRMMLRRVPSSIQVKAHIGEAVTEYDDPEFGRVPQNVRLLAVRLLEEAVSNALRHGNAGQIVVTLGIDEQRVLSMLVEDDGSGLPDNPEFSGLDSLRERLEALGGSVQLDCGSLGGARVTVTIPLATV